MRIALTSIFLVVFAILSAKSQVDSALVDVNFRFTDGLYKNVEQLRTNRPESRFSVLAGNLLLQEEDYLLKVDKLYPKGRADLPIALEEIGFRAFGIGKG